jgi:hypothetical protein
MTDANKDLGTLRAALSGAAAVCAPGEAGYAEAVNIWNAAIARRPSIVVRCAQDSDVVLRHWRLRVTARSRCRCAGVVTTTPDPR